MQKPNKLAFVNSTNLVVGVKLNKGEIRGSGFYARQMLMVSEKAAMA